jgi:hypothetical protein
MGPLLKARLIDGRELEFFSTPLASGGEKVAFFTKDRSHVICFFFNGLTDRSERRRRLENILGKFNVTTGKNGEYWKRHFCWPVAILDGDPSIPKLFLAQNNIIDPPLAVVSPAYRKNFFFKDTLGSTVEKNGKWFTGEKARKRLPPDERGTFLGYLQACTIMARAARRMHFAGLAHSDLSNRNVLIDPKNGEACVIDIDSLVVPGFAPPAVMGTRGYIAPEVLTGKGHPCIETDRHALAVLIYETLLLRNPLEGPKVNSRKSPEEDDNLSWGDKALFVEHPADRSNALKPPPTVPMERLGPYLVALLLKAFVEGLHQPKRRPAADEWERALYRTFDILHPSPDATNWFVLAPGMSMRCPFTGKKLTAPVPYAHFYSERRQGEYGSDGYGLTIYNDRVLMGCHVFSKILPTDPDGRNRRGYFCFHQGFWYLVNESDDPMEVLAPPCIRIGKGEHIRITPGLQVKLSTQPNGRVLRFEFMQ